MPKAKNVIQLPIKQLPVEKIAEQIKKLSKDHTVLAIWINPETNEFWYSTQQGECGLWQLLGAIELIKAELIASARQPEEL